MSVRRIWVSGHKGMVGSAIARCLTKRGDEVLKVDRETVDLRNQAAVEAWLRQNRPDAIVLAAARVGGIYANDTFPADFLYDNLAIEANVIHSAHLAGIDRLLFLGSSCIYPKLAAQPIKEEALLTGPLESTNEWYAIAKIAGIKLCQAYRKQHGRHYISIMPCNLYGPGDNFDLLTSHALPALIRKFYAGSDISVADLADLIGRIVGYRGKIVFDTTRPDGTPRKLLDSSRLAALGWKPEILLEEGIAGTYQWYLKHKTAGAILAA
jgi:GDP-L-fucose synthase